MSNETYDVLKLWAQIILPAICTLVFTIGNIWEIHFITDYSEQIVGTIAAIDTFLGVILKISSNEYYKGLHSKEE